MDASEHLSLNLKALRQQRGLTQERLAEAAGIPRATWANLESGAANPTLGVLVKVADALKVSLEELLSPPSATGRVYKRAEIAERTRQGVRMRDLIPDPLPSLRAERMELSPGARMKGSPHVAGTREYLACERGVVELVASGETYVLEEGDVVVFRGDQRHSYGNRGRATAVAYSVVVLALGR